METTNRDDYTILANGRQSAFATKNGMENNIIISRIPLVAMNKPIHSTYMELNISDDLWQWQALKLHCCQ
jgi:hypothetical protein